MFDFFIVGGDKRLSHMANLLAYKNFKVLAYDLDGENFNENVKQVNSIKFALKNSKNIIAPIPFSKDFTYLNSKNKKIHIEEILCNLKNHNKLFGGGFNNKILNFCEKKNFFIYDYLKNEKFVINNSINTAEAVVEKAILKNPVNMHFSKCLILGFGHCGKIIAKKLENLCSKVFVCVNNEMEKEWAKALGFSVFGLDSLSFKIEKFNYIFNTIPKKIFNCDLLDNLNKYALILDITKFGADKKECEKNLINYEYIPGIPGKFKFISSAEFLTDVTLKIIKKLK